MKTINYLRITLCIASILMSTAIFAQEEAEFEITPSADLVSNYVWRGTYNGGVSIQPSLTLSYGGLSLSAWGSSDFSTFAKELDLTLGYEYNGFLIAVTDYWWGDEGIRFGNYSAHHYLEGTIGYSFGEKFPLTLAWNTMFGFDGDRKPDEEDNPTGDRQYSTYIEAYYDFSVKGVDVTAGIGVAPWTSMYHREGKTGFALCALSLRATKPIRITDSFTLPIFAEVIYAPNQDNAFIVFGLTL